MHFYLTVLKMLCITIVLNDWHHFPPQPLLLLSPIKTITRPSGRKNWDPQLNIYLPYHKTNVDQGELSSFHDYGRLFSLVKLKQRRHGGWGGVVDSGKDQNQLLVIHHSSNNSEVRGDLGDKEIILHFYYHVHHKWTHNTPKPWDHHINTTGALHHLAWEICRHK